MWACWLAQSFSFQAQWCRDWKKALSVVVILKCDCSNFRSWEFIPVLGREGDVHTWMCLPMDVFWSSWVLILGCGIYCVAMIARETLITAFLTLIILYASNFSTISAPYQCFSSFQTRAEIIMIEPERIMLQKPSYCYQWIFVLLQPTEIMVWAGCTALKPISVCRNIIRVA